jgi:glycosidase
MVMDFTLQDALTVAFNETEQKWDKGLYRIYDNLTMDFLYAEPSNTLIFAENHDTDRFNEYCPKLEDYKLLMTLLATMRGIPQLYAGSEIGMKGNKSLGDADIRKDFPGGWSTDTQNAFIEKGTKNALSQEGRTEEQKAYFEITKLLFNWRKNKAVIHTGNTIQFIPERNVYVYFRYNEAEKVMVVLNNSLTEEKVDLSRFSEIMGTVTEAKDVISGAKINLGQKTLSIPAKTSLILELK